MLHPKKVGTLPVAGSDIEKQTNEIKIAIPLLDPIDITGKTITADALLTQRAFAVYLVDRRKADYHFTVKDNQKGLLEAITFYFDKTPRLADYCHLSGGEHGRIETRSIWVGSDLNDYVNFPFVRQVFKIERHVFNKKSQKESREVVYGVTSRTAEQASAEAVLHNNRHHWCIENSCHYIIDWNYDEDRSRIRTGYGPENMTRVRRFCVGLLKGRGVDNVAQKMRELMLNVRTVFDYLKMTKNTNRISIA